MGGFCHIWGGAGSSVFWSSLWLLAEMQERPKICIYLLQPTSRRTNLKKWAHYLHIIKSSMTKICFTDTLFQNTATFKIQVDLWLSLTDGHWNIISPQSGLELPLIALWIFPFPILAISCSQGHKLPKTLAFPLHKLASVEGALVQNYYPLNDSLTHGCRYQSY